MLEILLDVWKEWGDEIVDFEFAKQSQNRPTNVLIGIVEISEE